MRIMVISDDEGLQEEAKARIKAAFPEANFEDSNPRTDVVKTERSMVGERIKLIGLKDNHQIQTIFRRNREKVRVRKPRTIISIKVPLAVAELRESWFPKDAIVSVLVNDENVWRNAKPFILSAMGPNADKRLSRGVNYISAYSSSDVIIVMDGSKITTVAEDRFKVL